MATCTTVAARASAVLTGSGTVDYCSDLDMNLTADNCVTVEITGTKGSLTNIITGYHAGPAATPTMALTLGTITLVETITDATWTRVICLQSHARYFRVSVTGTGTNTSSDAVVNYYYKPAAATATITMQDGVPTLTTA